jgi:hypothetical protein
MSWTIACFCGNVYTAPPDRCAACGSTLDHAPPRPTASAIDVQVLAARAVTAADLRPPTGAIGSVRSGAGRPVPVIVGTGKGPPQDLGETGSARRAPGPAEQSSSGADRAVAMAALWSYFGR